MRPKSTCTLLNLIKNVHFGNPSICLHCCLSCDVTPNLRILKSMRIRKLKNKKEKKTPGDDGFNEIYTCIQCVMLRLFLSSVVVFNTFRAESIKSCSKRSIVEIFSAKTAVNTFGEDMRCNFFFGAV